MKLANFPVDRMQLAACCRKYGVTRLSVFGSSLREDFDQEHSDIDMLVEFAQDANKSLFTLVKLQDSLSTLFGRRVDLTTPNSLSKYFRDELLAAAEVLHEST